MIKSPYFSRKWQNIAGLDIGSGKICCWVGTYESDGRVRILGTGHAASQGLSAGNLTDVGALEKALASVIYEAEKEANVEIRHVLVTLSGAFFHSQYQTVTLPTTDQAVNNQDIQNLLARVVPPKEGYHPLHIIPLEFQVDQQQHIIDPRGIVGGKRLTGSLYTLWVYLGHIKTLLACLKRCQISVVNMVFSGYSAALACLVPDEHQLGATLVDIGSGGTTVACFFQDKMVASHFIPLGGYHITQDIARGCETTLAYAERLKILYGAAIPSQSDHHEAIPLLPLGEREMAASTQIARSFLINIIQARLEEILRCTRRCLDAIAIRYPLATQRIILTGGTSQLPGLRERAQLILERPVRIGKPIALENLQQASGEFSAVIGSFLYRGVSPLVPEPSLVSTYGAKKKWPPFFSWLRKNL